MPDYAKTLASVQRLLAKDGKPLTVTKRATAPSDPSKPWRGPGNAADTMLTVTGVIVGDRRTMPVSESTRRGTARALVAPTANGDDLNGFTELSDGTLTWEVTEVKPVQPGAILVLWEFLLKR